MSSQVSLGSAWLEIRRKVTKRGQLTPNYSESRYPSSTYACLLISQYFLILDYLRTFLQNPKTVNLPTNLPAP
jgi:hypothetical protein